MFRLHCKWPPSGDQPKAIVSLVKGLNSGLRDQVLLGVTGSGKTFTMANIIQKLNRPAIIMTPNKTLAAQLYEEMHGFFPENKVEYFVSYYDYYQPEAYIPQTDTYIEKDAVINEHIDRLRHSATRHLMEGRDVIVVCSVSCIYGLGDPETYAGMKYTIKQGQKIKIDDLLRKLTELQYDRGDISWGRGKFRVQGDITDIFPTHYKSVAWRLEFDCDAVEKIKVIDATTCSPMGQLDSITIYANSHYVTPRPIIDQAIQSIKGELREQLNFLRNKNKIVEATRLEARVKYDIEMMLETGTCKGIEHYSRYLNGTEPGEHPPTLFDYLPKDVILFVDESHISVPQVSSMYNGDKARKTALVEHGFRLPSALDNRPLTFAEWDKARPQTVFVSATPGPFELQLGPCIEQLIRPTGLVDPMVHIRPANNQIEDLVASITKIKALGERSLVTALTKKMAEHINEYLNDIGINSKYLHSEVKTIDRIEVINKLRRGEIDVVVGVNLLREGLDIPECSFVGILDGDKEGFLRSEGALLQTIGRAARNINGQVVIYADKITRSINKAIEETQKRRERQIAYNKQHNIEPRTIQKAISSNLEDRILAQIKEGIEGELTAPDADIDSVIKQMEEKMRQRAKDLDFETASQIKNHIIKLKRLHGRE